MGYAVGPQPARQRPQVLAGVHFQGDDQAAIRTAFGASAYRTGPRAGAAGCAGRRDGAE
jgi:hypothetical protein